MVFLITIHEIFAGQIQFMYYVHEIDINGGSVSITDTQIYVNHGSTAYAVEAVSPIASSYLLSVNFAVSAFSGSDSS